MKSRTKLLILIIFILCLMTLVGNTSEVNDLVFTEKQDITQQHYINLVSDPIYLTQEKITLLFECRSKKILSQDKTVRNILRKVIIIQRARLPTDNIR